MDSMLLITGAAGGLGSALAQEAARLGYDLVLTDVRHEGSALARMLAEKYEVEAQYRVCDLCSSNGRAEFLDGLRAEGYRFWGLLNVAGIDYEGAFMERSREEILRLLRTNIEATLDLTQGILALREPGSTFRLLNVCSMAAFQPMPYKAIYAASKRFLLDFSRSLSEELRGVATVTALCPAGLPTTVETMRRIFAQGFWGRVTAMDTQAVARGTMRRLLRGRRVYVPGVINQVICALSGMLPASLAARFVGRRWRKAQQEIAVWQITQTVIEQNGLVGVRIN
ncbi:MAG: SDR family NAD(P)-dependent oxidoreductase [Anaerolineae bacterium]